MTNLLLQSNSSTPSSTLSASSVKIVEETRKNFDDIESPECEHTNVDEEDHVCVDCGKVVDSNSEILLVRDTPLCRPYKRLKRSYTVRETDE
jgi:hypothetical protein